MIDRKSPQMKSVKWILRLLASVILLQSLIFKFGALPDSVALFTRLGLEPYGRIGLGIIELVVAIMILIPRTTIYGAMLGMIIMFGAILTHFFVLGIVFQKDEGSLFYLAVSCFLACTMLCIILKGRIFSKKRKYAN